jgi:hypothetical protein
MFISVEFEPRRRCRHASSRRHRATSYHARRQRVAAVVTPISYCRCAQPPFIQASATPSAPRTFSIVDLSIKGSIVLSSHKVTLTDYLSTLVEYQSQTLWLVAHL